MSKFEKVTNTKGKKVSICFVDGKAFDELIEGKSTQELISIFSALETTANTTIDECNNTIAKCIRANTKLEGMKNTEKLIEKNQETIDKNQDTIDNLEKDNAWWKSLQARIAQSFGDE